MADMIACQCSVSGGLLSGHAAVTLGEEILYGWTLTLVFTTPLTDFRATEAELAGAHERQYVLDNTMANEIIAGGTTLIVGFEGYCKDPAATLEQAAFTGNRTDRRAVWRP